MILGFINVSNKCGRGKNTVNRDGDFTVINGGQVLSAAVIVLQDAFTGSVVLSRSNASHWELSGLPVIDGTHTVQTHHQVGFLKGGQDFAAENLEKKCINPCTSIGRILTKTVGARN